MRPPTKDDLIDALVAAKQELATLRAKMAEAESHAYGIVWELERREDEYAAAQDAALAALRAQLVQAQARGDTYRRRALVLVRKLSKRKKPKVSMPGAYKRVVGIWRLRDSDAVARAERSMDRDDYIGHSIYDDKPPAPATPPGGEE